MRVCGHMTDQATYQAKRGSEMLETGKKIFEKEKSKKEKQTYVCTKKKKKSRIWNYIKGKQEEKCKCDQESHLDFRL